jgi:hypothetical protein
MQPLRDCAQAGIAGSCGYTVIYGHGDYIGNVGGQVGGGTGVGIAAFVDETPCKRVYDWLVENCEILYQSPVMRNSNSGRDNFLVVFKRK